MTRDDILFFAEASARYHRARATFFEGLSKTVTIASLVLGCAAFAAFFAPWQSVAPVAGLIVALINAYRLVGKPDETAKNHQSWLKRFNDMIADISSTSSPSPAKLKQWVAKRQAIEAECVVEMNALKAHCYNRAMGALDRTGQPYPLKRRHRLLKQWVSFPHAFDGMNFDD